MSTLANEHAVLRCDTANPGQFFACCGVLEAAAHRFGGSQGWFSQDGRTFCIRSERLLDASQFHSLFADLCTCTINNTMEPDELCRRDELMSMSQRQIEDSGRKEEKGALDSRWREAPVVFGPPFDFTIDWHQDDRGRGSIFKTWAGQQSIIELARGMQAAARATLVDSTTLERALMSGFRGDGLPFNFDSDLGAQAAPVDVGFSFDPLPAMPLGIRPMIELCAFIGLQRFRPLRIARENRYQYALWHVPLRPSVASAMAACAVNSLDRSVLEFRLLYRTKYLKSFLPAKRIER